MNPQLETEVSYKDHKGTIRFICDDYLTVCIHSNNNPMKDVCIVVYRNEWDLLNEI